ncbi:MAG: helix-turn-helix domain-containing protein [Rhizonema sp. PD38]|nr:helix-turn-helix domain-containing protein [Rhizonema sp. PD38]
MLRKVVKIRLDPTEEQQIQLAQAFGCSRWWWNYALNYSIETYKETGKGLGQSALNVSGRLYVSGLVHTAALIMTEMEMQQ